MNISQDKMDRLVEIYTRYIREVMSIDDIDRWSAKKSITKAVLTGTALAQVKVRNAVGSRIVQEGNKIHTFNVIEGTKQQVLKGDLVFLKTGEPKMIENNILKMVEDYEGKYDVAHYLSRVYKTVEILKNVLDMEQFVKYHLKGKRHLLDDL